MKLKIGIPMVVLTKSGHTYEIGADGKVAGNELVNGYTAIGATDGRNAPIDRGYVSTGRRLYLSLIGSGYDGLTSTVTKIEKQ